MICSEVLLIQLSSALQAELGLEAKSKASGMQDLCSSHPGMVGVGLRAEDLRRPGTRSLMAIAALGWLCARWQAGESEPTQHDGFTLQTNSK